MKIVLRNNFCNKNHIFLLRYTFSKKLTLKPDEVEKAGVKMKQTGEVTLETEYEKIKEIDIEHWENVRGKAHTSEISFISNSDIIYFLGPRPWEEVGTKQ